MSFEADVRACIDVLRKGGTILYPTDTIWGIGCDAGNEKAVEKVYAIKKRSDSKSLVVLANDARMLGRHVHEVPALAWELMEASETPLTIIYEEGINLAPNVLAEDGSIAIRIPKDEFCSKLLYLLGRPIVSTSANISGEPAPRNFSEISPVVLASVDYVVNWRQHERIPAKASSIIRLKANGEIKVIRK